MENNLEQKRMVLDATLAEYSEVKAESIGKLQVQITLISIYVSALGVLLSIVASPNASDDATFSVLSTPTFFALIFPCVSICLSIIWLDQVYRQIKIAVYISFLEQKINHILQCPNTLFDSAVFWEQWLRKNYSYKRKRKGGKIKNRIINPNQAFYYICLGIFIGAPLVSFFFGFYLVQFQLNKLLLQTIIFTVGYITFLGFIEMYRRQIFAFNCLVSGENRNKNDSQSTMQNLE